MKRRLGVSLYPDNSDFNQDKDYLVLAKKYGFSRIFMSMLEVSEGREVVFNKFKKIIDYAKSLDFERGYLQSSPITRHFACQRYHAPSCSQRDYC